MSADGGKDRFGDLPNDLLRHVLSFLPAEEALQTCMLDSRWRGLWRRTTTLLLAFVEYSLLSSERFKKLVKLFINLCGDSHLDKCEISVTLEDETNCAYTNTKLLIEYSLACQIKQFLFRRVGSSVHDGNELTFDVALISQHLKTIDLVLVSLEHSALDFTGCPVLEVVKTQGCMICARRMSSKSLKHLWITDFCYFPMKFHAQIYALGLISLQLDSFIGLSPLLENMPFLITAYVELADLCTDVLFCDDNPEYCNNPVCGCQSYPVGEGVLLNGLSNAVNLELIASPGKFIYTWDLEWCPIFGKLKTLLLNEWFRAIDLICILQHSPILEMLTLQLGDAKKLVCTTRAQETIEQSFVCTHLKVVIIKCRKVDEAIHKVLKILTTCGVLHEQISINDRCLPPLKNRFNSSEIGQTERHPPLKVPLMCAWL